MPFAICGFAGVTAIETSWAFTVTVVFAVNPSKVAVMVVVPEKTAVTVPVLSTVATLVAEELQVAWVERSLLLPLL